MGISQRIYTYYGWLEDVTPAVKQWADEIDYELPTGVMFVGMDSDNIALGVKLFESPDARWEPLSGLARFSHEEAQEELWYWYDNTDVPRCLFDLIEGKEPVFITFTNIT